MKKMILIIWLGLFYSYVSTADVVVIVHPTNDASISSADISKLFMGKSKRFSNGSSAVPINLPSDDAIRDQFNKKYIGKTQSQINSYWARLHFSGKATPPTEKQSSEILELIKSNPNMIGYIDESLVTDEVKVVK